MALSHINISWLLGFTVNIKLLQYFQGKFSFFKGVYNN